MIPRPEEIFSLLEEFRQVLIEEKQFLKKMDRTGLMNLLPRKLFLVDQIEKVARLETLDPKALLEIPNIREILSEIKILNETNKTFVEEALSLCNDFLSVLLPKNYCQNGKTETALLPPKGINLSMEA
ncbi:MAG: hypothetical protein WHS38_07275 [Thermodesulforhabdaceae bacterium]